MAIRVLRLGDNGLAEDVFDDDGTAEFSTESVHNNLVIQNHQRMTVYAEGAWTSVTHENPEEVDSYGPDEDPT